MNIRQLSIISPFYLPAPGGAGQYYSALAGKMLESGIIDEVEILTEKYPGKAGVENHMGGRLKISRLFPYRAGRLGNCRTRHLLYFLQNMQFLERGLRYSTKERSFIVHGSFYNNPSLIHQLFRMLKHRSSGRIRFIADLRDPKASTSNLRKIAEYDKVICCSENILQYVGKYVIEQKLNLIPVPFEVAKPSEADVDILLKRYGLKRRNYIFTPNGVQRQKSFDEILAMTEELNKQGIELKLVAAGKCRNWTPIHQQAKKAGLLEYIGTLTHSEVLGLTSAAALVPVISPAIEGMPRTAMEAIYLGTRVLLPLNVPEFEEACPWAIAKKLDRRSLANQARTVLERSAPNYNFEKHSWANVLPMYQKVLEV